MMDALPSTQSLDLELDRGWLTIWFNQPERRNPLTDDVVSELTAVLHALGHRRDVRGITLRGRGGFFCAGGDLKGFMALAEGDRESVLRTSETIGHLLAQLNAQPQVTVALIEGAAMAGGLGLACSCDVVLATCDAKFGFSETRIGISPAQIARFVIQKCGYSVGRRLMVTAARFDGDSAQGFGVVDQAFETVDLLEAAEQRIRADVLACAPGAIASTKALLDELARVSDAEKVDVAAANFTDCLQGDEGREGVASFLEKRKPNWHVEV